MLQVKVDNKKFEVKLGVVREEELFREIVLQLIKEGQALPTVVNDETPKVESKSLSEKANEINEKLREKLTEDKTENKIEGKLTKDKIEYFPKTTEHKSKPIPHWDDVEEEKPKRLVFAKCPKCGRQHHVYFNKNRITCLCGEDINFKDSDLTDGEYDCPHCKVGRGKFKVLGNIESVSCKECKGGIMLHYDFEKDMYTNN